MAYLGGALWQRATRAEVCAAFVVATRQVIPVFAALVAMVTVAYTMSESGMTTQLAVAAIGAMICPHNVIAAAATVGLAGREGELLKGTLPPAMVTLVITGGMALLLA